MNYVSRRTVITLTTLIVAIAISYFAFVDIYKVWAFLVGLGTDKIMIITAIASIAVAGIAAFAAVRQGAYNRKHNRLSVLPYLGFKNVDGQDEQNPSIRNFKIVIFNKGVGPALIKEFIMRFDGETIAENNYFEFFKKNLKEFKSHKVHQVSSGSAIKAGEEIELIGFKYDSQDKKFDFIGKLELFVKYQSVYKDMPLYSSHPKARRYESDPKPNPIAKEMALIHADCFTIPSPWTEASFASLLQNRTVFFVTHSHGVPIPSGFALGDWLDDTQVELLTLGVYTHQQGKGHGQALLDEFIAEVKRRGGQSVFLEVAKNNIPALRLYKKNGFKKVGLRTAYYKVPNAPPVDAILMRLDITE